VESRTEREGRGGGPREPHNTSWGVVGKVLGQGSEGIHTNGGGKTEEKHPAGCSSTQVFFGGKTILVHTKCWWGGKRWGRAKKSCSACNGQKNVMCGQMGLIELTRGGRSKGSWGRKEGIGEGLMLVSTTGRRGKQPAVGSGVGKKQHWQRGPKGGDSKKTSKKNRRWLTAPGGVWGSKGD